VCRFCPGPAGAALTRVGGQPGLPPRTFEHRAAAHASAFR